MLPVIGDARIVVFDGEIRVLGHAAQLQRMFVVIGDPSAVEEIGDDHLRFRAHGIASARPMDEPVL